MSGNATDRKALDSKNKLYYNFGMLNKTHKPLNAPYHRNTIQVVLQDGYKLRISNRAKKENVKFSEIVRQAIVKYFAN